MSGVLEPWDQMAILGHELQHANEVARAPEVRDQAGGLGLGLTLVRACAEAHGGTLELSSTHEAGTTFTMRFPMDARSARDANADPAP